MNIVRHRRLWIALGALLIALVAVVDVTITGPRVVVRWAEDVSASDRAALEGRYQLRNGRPLEGSTWRYELRDRSRENIEALVRDPGVDDTGYIDRDEFAAEEASVCVRMRFPLGPDPSELAQLQSLCLLLAGGGFLRIARMADERRRRRLAVATLCVTGVAAYMFTISPSLVSMGDAATYTFNRQYFEGYTGVREIRFEAHLSHAILGRIYVLFGRTAESPNLAFDTLMRGATAWFLVSALGIGFLERWSPLVVRYLALALLAPSALMYFGYRELGYLSLNVAMFPLIARGLRDGSARLEAGSVLCGLGAALHGFGLLSLAGSCLAAFATNVRLAERVRLVLRIAAWGTAAYLGWVAVYVIVLRLPIATGHADMIPLRPLLVDQQFGDRVNAAILSIAGGRDVLFTLWVVGAPLVVVAASLWRSCRDDVRTALWYAVPSVIFAVLFWPIQGLGVDTDLVFATFPALYGVAWVCAHDARRTMIAAALLAFAHIAFWRIVLDARFVT